MPLVSEPGLSSTSLVVLHCLTRFTDEVYWPAATVTLTVTVQVSDWQWLLDSVLLQPPVNMTRTLSLRWRQSAGESESDSDSKSDRRQPASLSEPPRSNL